MQNKVKNQDVGAGGQKRGFKLQLEGGAVR